MNIDWVMQMNWEIKYGEYLKCKQFMMKSLEK